jgi:hypothetical protein
MVYAITSDNLVVCHGGHKIKGMGHHRTYPIFKTEDGQEWISLNGQTLQRVADLSFEISRRETVQR